MAPWELNLYTYMLIFDYNMQKEWRYEVKYLLCGKIILCGISRLNFGGPRNVSEIGSTFQIWKLHLLLMKQKGLYTHHTSQKKDYETIIHEL